MVSASKREVMTCYCIMKSFSQTGTVIENPEVVQVALGMGSAPFPLPPSPPPRPPENFVRQVSEAPARGIGFRVGEG